jgi:hypothetical protein
MGAVIVSNARDFSGSASSIVVYCSGQELSRKE